MESADLIPNKLLSRRATICLVGAALLWLASLVAQSDWYALDHRGTIFSVQRGGIYIYFHPEPADASMTTFVERLRTYDNYPITFWSARSSIGWIIPTWAPLLMLLVSPAINRAIRQRFSRRMSRVDTAPPQESPPGDGTS